jgi:four helix bundle protein
MVTYGVIQITLVRAAPSIPLNIAEEAGEFAGREKACFYRIAGRSATESAAIRNVLARLGLAGVAQLGADLVGDFGTRLQDPDRCITRVE